MKILADDIYFFQVIFIDLAISNTPGKLGEKILTIYGTLQHFIISLSISIINSAFVGRALSL